MTANLNMPTFTDATAPTTLGHFLNDLLQTLSETNSTDIQRHRIYKVIQDNVTDKFPSYNRSLTLLGDQALLQYDCYPMCPNKVCCYVHPSKVAEMSEEQQAALKCPTCSEMLFTGKSLRPKQVSDRQVRHQSSRF
jgi:hypothetical protein